MKLTFEKKFISAFGTYHAYYEDGREAFYAKGKPAWGLHLEVYDSQRNVAALIRQRIMSFSPRIDIIRDGKTVGSVVRLFDVIHPSFTVSYNDWKVGGDVMQWDYTITDSFGNIIADMNRILLKLAKTYTIEVADENDVLNVFIVAVALESIRETRGSGSIIRSNHSYW